MVRSMKKYWEDGGKWEGRRQRGRGERTEASL
jgi:hypothetical protein